MSLDKWLKPEKKPPKKKPEKAKGPERSQKKPQTEKKPPKKKPEAKSPKKSEQLLKPDKKDSVKIIKYKLVCPTKRCNYQKIKVKRNLSERDKICPRCKGQMKVQKN